MPGSNWLGWFASAAVAGAVVLVGTLLVSLIVFRAERRTMATREVLRRQQQVLGPPTRPERFLIAALGILVIGLIFRPVLRVDPAWVKRSPWGWRAVPSTASDSGVPSTGAL